MEQFDARFRQVDVLPMVKYYMDEPDLFNLFAKYVPAATGSLADHAESLYILAANIILGTVIIGDFEICLTPMN